MHLNSVHLQPNLRLYRLQSNWLVSAIVLPNAAKFPKFPNWWETYMKLKYFSCKASYIWIEIT